MPWSYFVPQAAIALSQGSDGDDSSATSSLRTEKPLERQKEWEVDHARARARRLREESRQEFDQELRVRTNTMLQNTQDVRPSGVVPRARPTSYNRGVTSIDSEKQWLRKTVASEKQGRFFSIVASIGACSSPPFVEKVNLEVPPRGCGILSP